MFVVRCEIFSTYVWIESQDSGAHWNLRQPDDRPHGTDLIELLADERGTERSIDAVSAQCQELKAAPSHRAVP
jgi:hypothetical protein